MMYECEITFHAGPSPQRLKAKFGDKDNYLFSCSGIFGHKINHEIIFPLLFYVIKHIFIHKKHSGDTA